MTTCVHQSMCTRMMGRRTLPSAGDDPGSGLALGVGVPLGMVVEQVETRDALSIPSSRRQHEIGGDTATGERSATSNGFPPKANTVPADWVPPAKPLIEWHCSAPCYIAPPPLGRWLTLPPGPPRTPRGTRPLCRDWTVAEHPARDTRQSFLSGLSKWKIFVKDFSVKTDCGRHETGAVPMPGLRWASVADAGPT